MIQSIACTPACWMLTLKEEKSLQSGITGWKGIFFHFFFYICCIEVFLRPSQFVSKSLKLLWQLKVREKERNSNLEMSSKLLHIMEPWMKFWKSIRVISDGNILLTFKLTDYIFNVLGKTNFVFFCNL